MQVRVNQPNEAGGGAGVCMSLWSQTASRLGAVLLAAVRVSTRNQHAEGVDGIALCLRLRGQAFDGIEAMPVESWLLR